MQSFLGIRICNWISQWHNLSLVEFLIRSHWRKLESATVGKFILLLHQLGWWVNNGEFIPNIDSISTSACRMNCPSTILIPLLLKGRSCSARRFTLTNLLRNLLVQNGNISLAPRQTPVHEDNSHNSSRYILKPDTLYMFKGGLCLYLWHHDIMTQKCNTHPIPASKLKPESSTTPFSLNEAPVQCFFLGGYPRR